MRRALLIGLLISLGSGCGNSSPGETFTEPTPDGGPDGGVVVILDGGGAPATPPDGASLCPQGACNYQTGAGCPAGMSSCIPSVSGGSIVPACFAPGAGADGSACAKAADCAAGYFCAPDATCHKLCCGGDWTGCPSADEHCIERLDYKVGNNTIDTGAMLCYRVNICDALDPKAKCVEPGTTCQIVDATGATACFPEGSGASGEPCPCRGGFACVAGACRRLCKAVLGGGAPYCEAGEGWCVHFTRDPEGVGECSPP